MAPRLNDTERGILDYMVRYLRANTYQPSIREIGEEFGIKSTKTVSEYLRALADKGYLERTSSRSRGVRIVGVDLDSRTVTVPCYPGLGSVPEGTLHGEGGTRDRGAEMELALDRRLAGAVGSYMVRLQGGELAALDAGEGDLALVEPVDHPEAVREGDLVVARPHRGAPAFFRVAREEGRLVLRRVQGGEGPVPLAGSGRGEAEGASGEVDVTGRVVALHRRLDRQPVPVSPTAH